MVFIPLEIKLKTIMKYIFIATVFLGIAGCQLPTNNPPHPQKSTNYELVKYREIIPHNYNYYRKNNHNHNYKKTTQNGKDFYIHHSDFNHSFTDNGFNNRTEAPKVMSASDKKLSELMRACLEKHLSHSRMGAHNANETLSYK